MAARRYVISLQCFTAGRSERMKCFSYYFKNTIEVPNRLSTVAANGEIYETMSFLHGSPGILFVFIQYLILLFIQNIFPFLMGFNHTHNSP